MSGQPDATSQGLQVPYGSLGGSRRMAATRIHSFEQPPGSLVVQVYAISDMHFDHKCNEEAEWRIDAHCMT